jgi:hypothetical protein
MYIQKNALFSFILNETQSISKEDLFIYWFVVVNNVVFACLMVLNATFNNIPVISWRSVLLAEEIGGPGENHRPVVSH